MNTPGKAILNFGAMSGLGSFAVFLLLYYLGWNPLGQASWLGAWVPVVFICLSTAYVRNHLMGGYMSYGQAYRTGFLTAFGGAVLFSLMLYLFGKVIDPGLVESYKSEMLEGLENTKSIIGENLYESSVENLDKTTLFTIASGDFFSKALGGILVSLITAGFYRKQNPNPLKTEL